MSKTSKKVDLPLKIKLNTINSENKLKDEDGFRSPRTPQNKNTGTPSTNIFLSKSIRCTSRHNYSFLTKQITPKNVIDNRTPIEPTEMDMSNKLLKKKNQIIPIKISITTFYVDYL